MKKRFLASLLSLVMLLTMLPMTAFAATGDAYTIKFVAGTDATGTMADQTVAKAESGATSYTIPDSTFVAPTGKVFGEWTITAPAGTTDLKVENGVLSIPDTLETSQAITLTATWREPASNEYVINFAAGEGGTGTMTSQPVMKTTDADTEYSLPECAFEAPEGKEFKAWAVTAPTDGGLTIADGKLTIPAAVTVATTITLTATWDTASTPPSGQEITEVAVTLDTNDLTVGSALPEAGTDTEGATVSTKWYTAAGEEVKTTTFAAAGTYTAKITVAADTGYTLADTVTYKLNNVDAELKDGVLEPTATVAAAPAPANAYTIKFEAGGGEGKMADVTVPKAESGPTKYTLPTLAFTAPEGKEFDAWSWLNGIDLLIDKGILTIKEAVPTDDPIILTATWKPAVQKRYIVIAEGITNGTVTTNPPAGVVAVGTEVTVIATPADGYKLGAITVVDYQKNPVAVTGDKFTMPNSDVTVSATFVKEISITEEGEVSTDGNVTADIKPSDADLTAKIEEAKKATGDNKAVTFEVAVSDADADKAKTAEVTLAKTAVDAVAKADVAVIVKTPVATVNVPAATMKKIVAGTATNDVKLVVDKASTTDLGTNTASVGSFDVKFKDSNNKEVKVESALTLTMKVNTTATKVWVYIYKDGKASILGDTDEQYDVVNGEVTFLAPHLTAFVAKETQDSTAKPETKVELSFEAKKDLVGDGIVTVSGLEANKPHVIQIGKGTSNAISFVTSDKDGVLKFQTQNGVKISVWSTTATDITAASVNTLKNLVYEKAVTAATTK